MTDTTAEHVDVDALRDAAIAELRSAETITSSRVEAAFRAVPRHLFIPEADPKVAWDPYTAVVTRRDEDGNAVSSVSDMHVQSFMLDRAVIEPGMNVLEIGSGGYNAALLAELVGPEGRVTTVDIDPWVTDRAERLLADTGYGSRVRVVLADAEAGVPDQAPYDRILVTVGSWDVPPTWMDQLADDGVLFVPLRVLGLSRTIAFAKDPATPGGLTSIASKMFGFVPMRGEGGHQARLVLLDDGGVRLRFDDECEPLRPEALQAAVDTDPVEVWSGALIGTQELLDTVQMWLATTQPGFCWLYIDPDKPGKVTLPGTRTAAMGVVDDVDLAYVVTRTATDVAESVEFGVRAHGPGARALAERIAAQLRVWSRDHRGGPGAHYRVLPIPGVADGGPDERIIRKRHALISISWPRPTHPGGDRKAPPTTAKENHS